MTTLKQNCWEFRQCGREPGGFGADEFGVCPAALDSATDGLLGGKHRGRVCWAVMDTLCAGLPQSTFAQKRRFCMACDFFRKVKQEQGLRPSYHA